MALSPFEEYNSDRTLYYHPMSSFREFKVKTSIICNETGWSEYKHAFQLLGQSRGKYGHVSSSWMDRRGKAMKIPFWCIIKVFWNCVLVPIHAHRFLSFPIASFNEVLIR